MDAAKANAGVGWSDPSPNMIGKLPGQLKTICPHREAPAGSVARRLATIHGRLGPVVVSVLIAQKDQFLVGG